jgi:hypothetical protein
MSNSTANVSRTPPPEDPRTQASILRDQQTKITRATVQHKSDTSNH